MRVVASPWFVALPKYHFFRIFFHLNDNAWNPLNHSRFGPYMGSKKFYDIPSAESQGPDPGTQGPRSSISWPLKIHQQKQQQQRILAPKNPGIPPNRTMKEINTYPLFLGGTKVLRKMRSPKHSDRKKIGKNHDSLSCYLDHIKKWELYEDRRWVTQ